MADEIRSIPRIRREHLIIVIDSNILIGNYAFNSRDMENLLDLTQKTSSYIYMHEIVIEEVRAHIVNKCSEHIEKIIKNSKELEKWGDVKIPPIDKDKLIKTSLEKFERLVSLPDGVSIGTPDGGVSKEPSAFPVIIVGKIILAPLDASDLDEVLMRLIKRIAPCSRNGEEFRDAMIWLNMLRFCKKRFDGSPVAFISADKHFSDGNKQLKPELLEDVRKYGIDLEYFESLPEFLEKYSEPIKGIDRDWINSRIDFERVNELIKSKDILKMFNYYNNLGQEIELEEDAWTIKLKAFYLIRKESSLEVNLTFEVDIKNVADIKKDNKNNVSDIRFEVSGNIIDNKISINESTYSIRWNEI